jgi:thioredoxin reductase (NADPH)
MREEGRGVARPVIMTVDDDPHVLSSIERDLRRHYGADFRVLKAASPGEALEAARQLKKRGTPIALFLVDQRMPEMSGTQALAVLRGIHPDARRVLLTAYADTQAAIQSINEIGLDHYLMKPWDPPEQKLYPILDDLLSEWKSRVHLPFDGIRIAGARFSPQSHEVREFLSRNLVPYQWIDIDEDAGMRELLSNSPDGLERLPIVLFPDGTYLSAPTTIKLAEKVGLPTQASAPFYDVAIVGGGPAGLANAVYAATEGLRVILIEQNAPGGQAGMSSAIENYLGFPGGITGADLAQRATAQARRFGAELLSAQEAVAIARNDPYRVVKLAGGTDISSYVVVVTTGMAVRRLELPGIEPLHGRGVYYGASLSEATVYRGHDICIVGGANSAGQAALFFARYAKSVTMIVRAPSLAHKMSHYLVERITHLEKVRVLTSAEVVSVHGNGRLESVGLRDVTNGREYALPSSAMFVCIGTAPRSEVVAGFVDRDATGFIRTGPDLPRVNGKPAGWPLERDPFLFETNVPGVFAAGDVRAGSDRRVASAVGEGSAAIFSIRKYLDTV